MTKHRKGKPSKYHLNNWSEYNHALKQRGKIVFMIAKDIDGTWLAARHEGEQPGAPLVFTDTAIEICLQMRELLGKPLRQTEVFIEGLFEFAGTDLPVPSYSLLSKRAADLNVKLNRFNKDGPQKKLTHDEPVTITMDSTGLKIYGEGEWLKEKHKTKTRKSWMKAHVATDQNGYIVAESLTSTEIGDPTEAVNLLAQIPYDQVDTFYGDGAYDSASLHAEIEHKYPGINIVTSPRTDAVVSSRDHPTQRDMHIIKIEEKGRDAWQAISGYNQRNLVENTMFRLKTIFGGKLKARKTGNQQTEFTIKCSLLNKMNSLGMPSAYKVRSI